MIRLRTACVAGLLACVLAAPQPAAALDLEGALREVAAANPTLEARREMVVAAEHRVRARGARGFASRGGGSARRVGARALPVGQRPAGGRADRRGRARPDEG